MEDKRNALLYLTAYLLRVSWEIGCSPQGTVALVGQEHFLNVFEYHDVYHCLTWEQVAAEFLEEFGLHSRASHLLQKSPVLIANGLALMVAELSKSEDSNEVFKLWVEAVSSPLGRRLLDAGSIYYYQPPKYLAWMYEHNIVPEEEELPCS